MTTTFRMTAIKATLAGLAESVGKTTSTPAYWNLLISFERKFQNAGGRLVAGPDTGRHVYPGFGDQRNFELLVEAGFSVDETIKIMTSNGAETLGIGRQTGQIKPGYEADLIVLSGSLYESPSQIKTPRLIFKDGVGYDSASLIQDAK